jgi:hypothetical protein
VTARDALQVADQEVIDALPDRLRVDPDQGNGRAAIIRGREG